MMKTKYTLLYHALYSDRITALIDTVESLYKNLPRDEYVQHPVVKLLARIRKADQEIIPADPNKRDYYLKGALGKFRRYKQGLGRYRLIFCFSNTPPIIVYLYLNDEHHVRKDGDRNDPYNEFLRFFKKGVFSHDPQDKVLQKWIGSKI